MTSHTHHLKGKSIPSATSLPDSPRHDYDNRVRNYLISMGLRTACFIGAFFFSGWLRWTCVALAVVLPYFAVVFANATQKRRIDSLGAVDPDVRRRSIDQRSDHTDQ